MSHRCPATSFTINLPGCFSHQLQRIGLLAFALTSLLSWLSCSRSGGNGQELQMVIEKRVPSFDPRMSSDSAAERFRQLVFNSLVRKGDQFEPVPDLAESFEASADYKTFKFKLRPNIKFHDGKKLSALDVKYTFESMLATPAAQKRASFAQDLASIDLSPADPLLVIFTCHNPFPSLPNDLIPVGIIPEGSAEQQAKRPIGTGPFRFVSAIEDQEVVLSAYEEYFEGRAGVNGVRLKIVPDNTTRESELRKGSVDLAINADFDPITVEALQKAPGLNVTITEGSNIAHLGINLLDPILKDVRVRQALAHALDREAIIRDVLRGQAKLAASILPVSQWAYEPNVKQYAYDPARALQLLDEAGYLTKDNQPRLKLSLKTSPLSVARKVGEAIQEQLRKVGIQLELKAMERQTLTQDMTTGNYQLYYNTLVGGNQSTDIFRFVYDSRSVPPNGSNRSRYNNPKLDQWLKEAMLADQTKRRELFGQVQKTLAEDLPQIYLWYPATITVARARVSAFKPDVSGDWRVVRQLRIQ